MTYRRSKLKVAIVAVVLVAAIAGFFSLRSQPSKQQPGPASPTASPNTASTQGAQASLVETADFAYPKPSGWAKLSPGVLTANAADSGIGLIGKPTLFTVQVSSSTPKDAADLKTSTLNTLKKLTNFGLISTDNTKVGGQGAQRFIYTLGSPTKTKEELTVVIYKNKTFLLLETSPNTDFSSHSTDFNTILSGFKFN